MDRDSARADSTTCAVLSLKRCRFCSEDDSCVSSSGPDTPHDTARGQAPPRALATSASWSWCSLLAICTARGGSEARGMGRILLPPPAAFRTCTRRAQRRVASRQPRDRETHQHGLKLVVRRLVHKAHLQSVGSQSAVSQQGWQSFARWAPAPFAWSAAPPGAAGAGACPWCGDGSEQAAKKRPADLGGSATWWQKRALRDPVPPEQVGLGH